MGEPNVYALDSIRVGERFRRHRAPIDPPSPNMPPILITWNLRLISGHRRLEACRRAGRHTVPAVVAETLNDVVASMVRERPTAVPMVFTDQMRIADVIWRMPYTAGTDHIGNPVRSRELVAAALGRSGSAMGRCWRVWTALSAPNHPRRELLNDIDVGLATVTGVHAALFCGNQVVSEDVLPLPAAPTRWRDAQILHNIGVTLASLTRTLGEVDSRAACWVPADEVDELADRIRSFVRAAGPVARKLRERRGNQEDM